MTRSRAQYRAQPHDHAGTHRIDTGIAEILADTADPGGWSVVVNGVPSSYVNLDAALVTLARRSFGLRGVSGLRIRTGDGRSGVVGLPAGSSDVARVVRHSAVYVANIADSSAVREAKIEAAAALKVFAHVALVAEPAQLRGRRFGNVILLASNAPLPIAALTRKLAGGAVRATLVPPERVIQLVSGVSARDDPAT